VQTPGSSAPGDAGVVVVALVVVVVVALIPVFFRAGI